MNTSLPCFLVAVCSAASLLSGCGNPPSAQDPESAVYAVRLNHPSYEGTNTPVQQLVQVLDEQGLPAEYYADTESVFCLDQICAVVPVRLYWDDIGRYRRYELAEGITLEKDEGRPFTEADYQQLQTILSDPDSALKDVRLSDIKLHSKTEGEVDGTTHATPILYKDAAVPGAAWTCYTLWHWANGEINQRIRTISAKCLTLPDLHQKLAKGDTPQRLFAIEELTARGAFDAASIAGTVAVLKSAPLELTTRVLDYLSQAPAETYYRAMEVAFTTAGPDQRIMLLNHLIQTDLPAPPDSMEHFSKQLPDVQTYQEADLLLTLLEARIPGSPTVTEGALTLLDHASFLVARRAFWFLEERALNAQQRKKVDSFRIRNETRL